jgi:hypothetical protein
MIKQGDKSTVLANGTRPLGSSTKAATRTCQTRWCEKIGLHSNSRCNTTIQLDKGWAPASTNMQPFVRARKTATPRKTHTGVDT